MRDMWEKGYINDKNLELFYKEIKKEIEKWYYAELFKNSS
jgi:hypothetical protein